MQAESKSIVVPRGPKGERAPTLAAIVRTLCDLPWKRARELCHRGKVRVNGEVCTDAAIRISPGSRVAVDPTAERLRAGELSEDALVHVDRDVVVVHKPAGVMTVPFSPDDRDTLVDRVRLALKRRSGRNAELGVVQRLDKDTTGLLVFARTLAAKRHLQQQLRRHSIERVYLALVHGACSIPREIDTQLLRNRGDGLRGSYGHFRKPKGPVPDDAERAITEMAPLSIFRGASLLRCRLRTGRQHQIRIHLSELGHPLIGEQVYIRDYRGPQLAAPRPMLHATVLQFEHPRTGEWLEFEAPPPADFAALQQQLAAVKAPDV